MQLRLAAVFSVASFVVGDKVGTSCLWTWFSVKRTECPHNSPCMIRVSGKGKESIQPKAHAGVCSLKTKR